MTGGSDLVRAHEGRLAAEAGAVVVVGRERRSRLGRTALPAMRLNTVAMIDIVFLLLIYFMLITEFKRPEEAMWLDMPARLSGAPADPFEIPRRPIVVTVHSFGDGPLDCVVQADAPELAGVEDARTLHELLGGDGAGRYDGEQRFVIRPLPGVRWEHALGALNAVRRAGFTEVRFASPG